MAMDYLDPGERTELEDRRAADAFVAECLRQLDRICSSRQFARVRPEARGFLGFVVAKKLLGKESEIKEVTIAIHVFHEPADYDSAESAKIRVAAANLRQRLSQYYAGEGRKDPIQIVIPTGTYVPDILDRRVTIVVREFEDWNRDTSQVHLCGAVSGEIARLLARPGSVEVRRVSSNEVPDLEAGYLLRGNLQCRDGLLLLGVSLSEFQTNRIIFWETFQGPRYDVLKLAEQVASAITALWQGSSDSASMKSQCGDSEPSESSGHGHPSRI